MTAPAPFDRAIIVAAGRGSRLGPKTEDIPKTMVEVAGKPILHHQLDALSAGGVSDFVVVRGYRGSLIGGGSHRLRFVENPEWERNNILASLIYARAEMDRGFFFAYSDIVYAKDVAVRLAEAARTEKASAVLVVDRRWSDAYVGRTLHPIPEAELSAAAGPPSDPRITAVGKLVVPAEEAAGEFIGLAYFSPEGARALCDVWDRALGERGLEAPFGRARALRHAYLSDALNALANAGHRLAPLYIDGQWREIDTGQDLAAAEPIVSSFST
jgi:L-glutamine-phosphate cytidylyltransferase